VRHNLGVRFRHELVPFALQLLFQLEVVLDDAVVHHDHLPRAVAMRVRILFRRPSVGRPAGMADAGETLQRLAVQPVLQIAELALGATARQHATLERGDTGGVVAAVFEALQRIDKLPRHRFMAENSDNSAQGR
jgi:hypothetical protein